MTQTTMNPEEAGRKATVNRMKKTAPVKKVEEVLPTEVVPSQPVTPEPVKEVVPEKAHVAMKVKPELRPEDYVTVRNGFNGKLVYRSRNSNETFIWDGFGAEQEMELRELKHARNTARSYFSNNWFMFDDPAIVEWLGVGMYYKNALDVDEIDDLFTMSPSEIERTIRSLPSGQKETVANRAKDLIRMGEKIDSVRVIHALERALGIELSLSQTRR